MTTSCLYAHPPTPFHNPSIPRPMDTSRATLVWPRLFFFLLITLSILSRGLTASESFVGQDEAGNIHINTSSRVYVNGVDVLAQIEALSEGLPRLYMVGGNASLPVEVYDGFSWRPAPSPKLIAVSGVAAAVFRNAIVAAGGVTNQVTNAVEKFNGHTWTSMPAMLLPRCYHGLAVFQDRLYAVSGGYNRTGTATFLYTNTAERFDGQVWESVQRIPRALFLVTTAVFNNALYVKGNEAGASYVYRFDGATWFAVPHMISRNLFGTIITYDGFLYSLSDMTERYNGTNWETVSGQMAVARIVFASCVFRSSVYVLGGGDAVSNGQREVERFTGGAWQNMSALNAHRYGGSAVVF